MHRPALAALVLAALALAGCGATLSDPLAIGPMLRRCEEQAARGERPRELLYQSQVVPLLGCR